MQKKAKKTLNPTWSLTVGNGGENHTGMEFIGKLRKAGEGWDLDRLLYAKGILENVFGKTVEYVITLMRRVWRVSRFLRRVSRKMLI